MRVQTLGRGLARPFETIGLYLYWSHTFWGIQHQPWLSRCLWSGQITAYGRQVEYTSLCKLLQADRGGGRKGVYRGLSAQCWAETYIGCWKSCILLYAEAEHDFYCCKRLLSFTLWWTGMGISLLIGRPTTSATLYHYIVATLHCIVNIGWLTFVNFKEIFCSWVHVVVNVLIELFGVYSYQPLTTISAVSRGYTAYSKQKRFSNWLILI